MERFNPQVGAVDTSNFINVAALNQQGRNATQDRQLAAREMASKISSDTQHLKLDANEQKLQMLAIEQQNEMALRELSVRLENLGGQFVQQNADRTLQQQSLVQQGQQFDQNLDLENRRLDSGNELEKLRIASGESEGAKGREASSSESDLERKARVSEAKLAYELNLQGMKENIRAQGVPEAVMGVIFSAAQEKDLGSLKTAQALARNEVEQSAIQQVIDTTIEGLVKDLEHASGSSAKKKSKFFDLLEDASPNLRARLLDSPFARMLGLAPNPSSANTRTTSSPTSLPVSTQNGDITTQGGKSYRRGVEVNPATGQRW